MKISVIVPVYNVQKYLKRCMDSLLAQAFSDREIILVDDGSTDGSAALCDSYAALPDIRVIHQENAGLGMARNSGIKAASGEYLLFVDSDDYVGPGLLSTLCDAVEKYDADLAVGGFTLVSPDGKERRNLYVKESRFFSENDLKELALNIVGSLPEEALDSKYGMSVWARLYRRSVIEENQIRFVSERELISEDLIFNLDFLKCARRAVVAPNAAYFYCANPGSLTKGHRADRFQCDCKLYTAVERFLSADFEEQEYRWYLRRLLISRARFDMAQEVLYHDKADRQYPLYQRLKEIADNPLLQAALEGYPWRKLPKMQGLFAWGLKGGRIRLLIRFIRLRQRFFS